MEFEDNEVVSDLKLGHHLVLTGGSPLLQQKGLVELIDSFVERFGFKPYIEIENECTLVPSERMLEIVDCWNSRKKIIRQGNQCGTSKTE
jgi:organic radical activating enzyme